MIIKTIDTESANRLDVLLSTVYLLSLIENDVSLSVIQDCIREFQSDYQLGYIFSKRFNSSYELTTDIEKLIDSGYIHEFNYRRDSFLPKRYFNITPLGIGYSRQLIEKLPQRLIENLHSRVEEAINNHHSRWRLWARYE